MDENEEYYVIEEKSIRIPEGVNTIEDPEEAPIRIPEGVEKDEYSNQNIREVSRDDYFRFEQPFVIIQFHSDFHGNGWYAEVFPEPGSSPEFQEHVADEEHAVKQAIHFAEKYEIPFCTTKI